MKTSAPIFDIQRFSVHDGPGIRTILFLKGCPLRCQWCANPESHNATPDLMFFPDKCIGCQECISQCTPGAIRAEVSLAYTGHTLCTNCGACALICPSKARKISGKMHSPDDILPELEQDLLFYKNSGGGITFSGGEPLLWPEFIREVAAYYKEKEVNTAVETCGHFPLENFLAVKDVIDLVMFDMKLIDDDKHIRYCAVSNKTILSNFASLTELVETGELAPLIVRIPIIPGINDTPEDLENAARFLSAFSAYFSQVQILPYHNLGANKYHALGRPYPLDHVTPPTVEHMDEIKSFLESHGFSVKIGG